MASSGYVVGGRYRLDSVLGSGGMGVVWRAFDERLARWVAVKEIRFTQPMTPEEREEVKHRAMVEALTAGRLVHPNVVAIYDAVDDADQPWIVMRLVEGRSLRELVAQEGPLDSVRAARLGLGLLDALDAAHAAGVVHRDVKPSNVLIAGGRPLLTDFSIATVAGAPVPLRGAAVMGSPGYVAPERLYGEEGGVPADLFGLGATLFYAVEGYGPFAREDAMACLIATVCDPHPRPVRGLALAAAIDGLLAKDVADRMDSAAARAALLAAARPKTRTAYRVPLTSRRAYIGHHSAALLPAAAAPARRDPAATAPPTPGKRRPVPSRRRQRITILTATAALLVPVAATLASTGGPNSAGLAGRADAAVRPAPPGVDPSAAPPDEDARGLAMPGVLLSPSGGAYSTAGPGHQAGVIATDSVVGDTSSSGTTEPVTEPSGGGGGDTGGTTTAPPAPEVTGLTVTVTVNPTDCTFSASAMVSVSAPTTVTYRVSWPGGSSGPASAQLTGTGGTLEAPSGVPHGAGQVWVEVDVLSPTAVTRRDTGELPESCSPSSPSPEPDPSPMTSPSSSADPAPPADQSTPAADAPLSLPATTP